MTLLRSILHCILLAVAIVAIASFAWEWTLTNRAARASLQPVPAILARVNGPTGPVTEADKLLLALRSVTTHGDMVIAHEERSLGTYDGYAARVSGDLHTVAGNLNAATLSASAAAQSAAAAIGTADETIKTAQPLLASLNSTAQASTTLVQTANARLRDPQIDALLAHFDTITASGAETSQNIAGITSDLHTWSHPYLVPSKCVGFKCKFGRYAWPMIKDLTGIGDGAAAVRQLFEYPIPVKLAK